MRLNGHLLVKKVKGVRTSRTPEYRTWLHLKERCLNPNHHKSQDYLGRGIKVCDAWKNSFETFYRDMGDKPSPKHSIDRINNDGDYEPGNCRWATMLQQASNTRHKNKYGYTGIKLIHNKSKNVWVAHIYHHNRNHHLGTFDTKDDAIIARKKAEEELLLVD